MTKILTVEEAVEKIYPGWNGLSLSECYQAHPSCQDLYRYGRKGKIYDIPLQLARYWNYEDPIFFEIYIGRIEPIIGWSIIAWHSYKPFTWEEWKALGTYSSK